MWCPLVLTQHTVIKIKFQKVYLDHVVDLGLDKVEQSRDASFSRLFDLDGAPADGPNRFPDKVDINFGSVPKRGE